MAIVTPSNTAVLNLRGLHLYHAGRSNCSARVRLLLEEKGLHWTSHYVDIYQRANVTAEYFGINPKGLVPTLVHDGQVVVESNDILLYLEQAFPEPSFSPAAAADCENMKAWLVRSGNIHMPGIKTFAYARQHAKNVVKSAEQVALYRSLQKDPDLLAFHGKHDLPGQAFTEQDVDNATGLLSDAFGEMNNILANADWLVGNIYTLADISWAPSITTLEGVGFPVAAYPRVMDWYARVAERPAFQQAVRKWRERALEGDVEIKPGMDFDTVKSEE